MSAFKWPWRSVQEGARAEDDIPRGNFLRSVALSVTFHAGVVAAFLIALRVMPPVESPPVAKVILINLVALGEITSSPRADEKADLPQSQATEHADVPDPRAIPTAQSAPAQKILRPADPVNTPQAADAPAKAAAVAPLRPQPADELSARLQQLAKLSQPAPPQPPAPKEQDGTGVSNRTVASDAAIGTDATYRVKDYLRAQIERRWNVAVPQARNLTASIRLEIQPDGTVLRAEIVVDQARRNNKAYEEFARSARNAALLSSPLTLLPGSYAIAKDIVIDFDARRLLR